MSTTVPLPDPSATALPNADTVTSGPAIPAIERIRLFSPRQWEEFVLEWAYSLRSLYARVERCGGAGDMGRDVVATANETDPSVWDNYQCKHYGHPLMPSEIWLELGKLVYYTHLGEFTVPRAYRFVAPQGAGSTLSKLFEKPENLRTELIENWEAKCRHLITQTIEVPLSPELLTHLNSIDFSIFSYIPPLKLIDQHRTTPWHIARFGGGLPPRLDAETPPTEPAANEAVYLRKLFEAYSDARGNTASRFADIAAEPQYSGHYSDCRLEFYSAESLRGFSRDTLPAGSFEQLQDEIHSGIRDTLRETHTNGFQRLLAVVGSARALQLTSHPLVPRMHIRDRGGVCHQLANDRDDVQWVQR